MNNELYHWGLKKGEERKGHRYLDRILVGTKNGKNIYKYIYDIKDKIKASRAKMEESKKSKQIKGDDSKKKNAGFLVPIPIPKKAKDALNKLKNKLVNTLKDTSSYKKGLKALKDKIDKKVEERNKPYKYIAKIETPDGPRYFYDKKELEAYYRKNGNFAEQALLKRYGLKQDSNLPTQDMSVINEHYSSGGLQYGNNCYSCTLSYDLRRRGFDVEAIPDTDGLDIESVYYNYKGIDNQFRYNSRPATPRAMSRAFINDAKSNGDGTHGMITVYWQGGSGHAMAWEVKNNQVLIRDCQTNTIYTEEQITMLMRYTACSETAGAVHWARTDNLELDPSILKYVQKNTQNQYTGTVAR